MPIHNAASCPSLARRIVGPVAMHIGRNILSTSYFVQLRAVREDLCHSPLTSPWHTAPCTFSPLSRMPADYS
jgi:hypothetical protein